MLKRLALLLVSITALVWLNPVSAQNAAYTIIANPGENASSEIRLNWHTNLGSGDSYITYTKKSDKNWKKAIRARADQELCTVFDSIYSKKPNGENLYEDARFLRNTIALQGLKEDTEYKYKFSSEKYASGSSYSNGNSEIHYFKTAPKSVKWDMGIISDMHVYAPLPNRQNAAMEMIQQLEKQNKKPFDMMLHVGDISAWGGSYSFWPTLYADSTFSKYVWAGVNGNHDNMTRLNAQSNKFFRNVNNNPINGYVGEIGVSYYFIYGDALFVMLNNEAMKSAEELAKAQDWTKEVIKNNPAKYIIVLSHYQWFMGDDGRSSQYSRWKELFDEYGVDLAISGNNHIYVRTNALYADQETDGSKGTVYIQTPSSDNERGRPVGEQLHNKDLIKFRWSEGSKTVGALIMKANKKRLTLTLYDRNGNAIDQVSVKSKSKKLW
ncbi:MAG: metallophosphoesterase family protein [Bacteroidota bacterium]